MQRLLVLMMGLCMGFTLQAIENDSFHRVPALPGDGVYSLLRRYQLDQHDCNFEKFYSLNGIKKNSGLVVGRKYFIPVMIYSYNGRTIRSSIGIDNWDLAVRIQDYNEAMLEKKLRRQSFKSSKILWVPFHELHCPESTADTPVTNTPSESEPEPYREVPPPAPAPAPVKPQKRKFPIFGPKYALTPLMSNKLKGQVFYVVAGHGGPDPGAQTKRGNYTMCEDEYAYDVALRFCRNLVMHGATAYMVNRDPNDGIRSEKFLKCDTDEFLWGNIKMSKNHRERLFQRSEVLNKLYDRNLLQGVVDQKIIIIHVDSRTRSQQIDLFFYHRANHKPSRDLALDLHKTMKRKYKKYRASGQYHGTVSSRDLHMLRETKAPAVYVELGNIRNTHDQQRIILERNRQAVADWLTEGLFSN